MQAEIISVGTELLLGQIIDTNAPFLSKLLPLFGISIYRRVTVGDNEARLFDAIQTALSRADIVFTIGGLGPTQDDLTKETVAKVVGDEMILNEEWANNLRTFFAERGIIMPKSNIKQALAPVRGRLLDNPKGTAPGAVFETSDKKVVIVLPGPPREFEPMVKNQVTTFLKEFIGETGQVIESRILRIAGIGESIAEERIKSLLDSKNPTVAPYAGLGEVHLRITAQADTTENALYLIDEMDSKITSIFGSNIFGRDDESLEKVVVDLLSKNHLTLAAAESCTGGFVSHRITNIAGSSDVFIESIVSYSNEAKKSLLNVPEDIISKNGAVSEETARAMAEGIRNISGADIGIAITGIAGPGGGSKEKPVGLVYTALATDKNTIVQENQFMGNRLDIKQRTSQAMLDMIRIHLLSDSANISN